MKQISSSKRLIVKIGSSLIMDNSIAEVRRGWLESLACDILSAKERGSDVILVSSGAIAIGRSLLKLKSINLSLEESQAAAAVGQIKLSQVYEDALAPLGIMTAQVLLTLEDSENRRRYLNSRTTLNKLLSLGVVPIVNENDTVATDEIRFGDNDRLASQVAIMVGADNLILFSDVDGLFTANPHNDGSSKHLNEIKEITPKIEAMAGDSSSAISKGGMRTKIIAAKSATSAGCSVVICNGKENYPISNLLKGQINTLFHAKNDPQTSRKNWISSMKIKGSIRIDLGAVDALKNGKSLLPAGVTEVLGSFSRGDPVEIIDGNGESFGKGLINYDNIEVSAIFGKQSYEVKEILGYSGRVSVVHRDNMVI
jgi:glutamate 5-kinase